MKNLADEIGRWIGLQPIESGVNGRVMIAEIRRRWPGATDEDIGRAIDIGVDRRAQVLADALAAAGGTPN